MCVCGGRQTEAADGTGRERQEGSTQERGPRAEQQSFVVLLKGMIPWLGAGVGWGGVSPGRKEVDA